MGNDGVPTVEAFLKETIKKGAKIAFDCKVISIEYFRGLKSTLESSGFSYEINEDLVDMMKKFG